MYILLYAHFLWRQESSGSFTNCIFSPIVYLTVLDWVQYKYQRSFFLNYSIKCQHTHILACSSYDLIRNMMLTLVCQSRPTGAAHLVRKKKHSVASFSWNPTKRGQPKQTLMSLIGASFCIILNNSSMKKKSQTCIPSYRGKQTEARRGSNCLKSI